MLLALFLFTLLSNSGQQSDVVCEFTSHVINSNTIAALANRSCTYINGSVRIDESSDVTYEQLAEVFEIVHIIYGTLEIVNTPYKNLSFFTALERMKPATERSGYDLTIQNNTHLESADGVLIPFIYVRILDNPLLALNCTYVVEEYSTVRKIRGNKNNCGCELDGPLTEAAMLTFEDGCELIYDYVDLGFLSNVQEISYYGSFDEPLSKTLLQISGNDQLQRLGWNKLTDVSILSLQISGNPKLCYTVKELSSLLSTLDVDNVEGAICEGTTTPDVDPNSERLCRIGNDTALASIPADCEMLIGRLAIDNSTDTTELWKLFNVTTIYGQLSIKNASITSLAALWKLESVINLTANETAVVIESNKRLRSAFLGNIHRVLSNRPVTIQDNTAMMLSDKDCEKLNQTTRIHSAGNRRNCPDTTKSSSMWLNSGWYVSVLLFIFLATRYPEM